MPGSCLARILAGLSCPERGPWSGRRTPAAAHDRMTVRRNLAAGIPAGREREPTSRCDGGPCPMACLRYASLQLGHTLVSRTRATPPYRRLHADRCDGHRRQAMGVGRRLIKLAKIGSPERDHPSHPTRG
jgi:hypothetical protein